MPKKSIVFLVTTMLWLLLFAGQARADVLGMDVSRWQGTIDWETARDHIDFTIIKAGGSDVGMYTDREFVRNRDEARRLGIPRGYYYFAGGGDPAREAEHFASIIGELQPGEVVALDMEVYPQDSVAYSLTFLRRAEELLGVKPMLYTNMNRVWGDDWRPVAADGYPLWGAIFDHDFQTFPKPGAWPKVSIKQFTSKGTIPGVSSEFVDLNVIKGDIGVFQQLGKAEPKVEPEITPAAAEAAKPPEPPRVPRPGYMGGIGDGRRNSLDSGQTPPFAPLPEEPEAAAKAGEQEQELATKSHKGSADDANPGAVDSGEVKGSTGTDGDSAFEDHEDTDSPDAGGSDKAKTDGDGGSSKTTSSGSSPDSENRENDDPASQRHAPERSGSSTFSSFLEFFLSGLR